MMEHESWITGVYKEFWDTADELATKEQVNNKANRRDRHLDAMVMMFIETMRAPVANKSCDEEDDCEGDDYNEENCKGCPEYMECQLRNIQQSKQN
jgi:hypothetical protein